MSETIGDYYRSFVSKALDFIEIALRLPIKGEQFPTAKLPGFPYQQVIYNVCRIALRLNIIINDTDWDSMDRRNDKTGDSLSDEEKYSIDWFESLFNILMERWGWDSSIFNAFVHLGDWAELPEGMDWKEFPILENYSLNKGEYEVIIMAYPDTLLHAVGGDGNEIIGLLAHYPWRQLHQDSETESFTDHGMSRISLYLILTERFHQRLVSLGVYLEYEEHLALERLYQELSAIHSRITITDSTKIQIAEPHSPSTDVSDEPADSTPVSIEPVSTPTNVDAVPVIQAENSGLSKEEMEAFGLYVLRSWKQNDIAKHQGVNQATVSRRIKKAQSRIGSRFVGESQNRPPKTISVDPSKIDSLERRA